MHFDSVFILFQSTSGVSVNPDVQRSFQRLSDSKEYRYILFKIEVSTLVSIFFFIPLPSPSLPSASFCETDLLRHCLFNYSGKCTVTLGSTHS